MLLLARLKIPSPGLGQRTAARDRQIYQCGRCVADRSVGKRLVPIMVIIEVPGAAVEIHDHSGIVCDIAPESRGSVQKQIHRETVCRP